MFRTFSVVASLVVIAVEGAPFKNQTRSSSAITLHGNEDGSGNKLGDDGHNATSSTTTPAWNVLTEMRPTVPPDHRKLARTVFGITATTCAGLLVIVVILTGWRYTYYKCTDEGPCCCFTHHSTTSGESVLRTVCSLRKKVVHLIRFVLPMNYYAAGVRSVGSCKMREATHAASAISTIRNFCSLGLTSFWYFPFHCPCRH